MSELTSKLRQYSAPDRPVPVNEDTTRELVKLCAAAAAEIEGLYGALRSIECIISDELVDDET